MLGVPKELRCVTWGLKSSLVNEKTDAGVAKKVAEHFGLNWQYMETNISDEPMEVLLNRYLVAGEGRVDHISAYIDGFDIWKRLAEQGVAGVLRGDEAFGNAPLVSTEFDVRRSSQVLFASDYSNIPGPEEFGFDEQHLPEDLQRRENETLDTWRELIYQGFRILTGMSALNELKTTYVELANPYLSRRVVNQIRSLPDSLRLNKIVFREIMKSISPDIEYAKYPAPASREEVLSDSRLKDVIIRELDTKYARHLLSEKLVELVLNAIRPGRQKQQKKMGWLRKLIRYYTPPTVKNFLKNKVIRAKIDYDVLAYRAYSICRMHKMLSDDAAALSENI